MYSQGINKSLKLCYYFCKGQIHVRFMPQNAEINEDYKIIT